MGLSRIEHLDVFNIRQSTSCHFHHLESWPASQAASSSNCSSGSSYRNKPDHQEKKQKSILTFNIPKKKSLCHWHMNLSILTSLLSSVQVQTTSWTVTHRYLKCTSNTKYVNPIALFPLKNMFLQFSSLSQSNCKILKWLVKCILLIIQFLSLYPPLWKPAFL